jgi:predicted acyl esterase
MYVVSVMQFRIGEDMKKLLLFISAIILFSQPLKSFYQDSLMLEMSDGIKLFTKIHFPDTSLVPSDYPRPVILVRTAHALGLYDQSMYDQVILQITDVKRYILIEQDFRGRDKSEGAATFFETEKQDGLETIEWIGDQDWCDGNVAMFGFSGIAMAQYLAATAQPENFVVGFPMVGAWNGYEQIAYPGGEYRYEIEQWFETNDLSNEAIDSVKSNYNYNESWDYLNMGLYASDIKVPFMHLGGWYGVFMPGVIDAFYDLNYNGGDGAKGNQRLIVGPWTHLSAILDDNRSGEFTFPNVQVGTNSIFRALNWFDHIIFGTDNYISDEKPIRLYLMGPFDQQDYWNDWLEFDDWPFSNTDTLTFYPDKYGMMGFDVPDEDSLGFTYDPMNPVPTAGGSNFSIPAGPYHQSDSVWFRNDVLIFVTPTYQQPFDIFGRIEAKIYMSSDVFDTDITAKLVDMYPNGRRVLITDGIKMARHRNSFEREDFLTPSNIYELSVDLNYMAYTIAPGHRLGLAISSSNFPRYAVNPNTGAPVNSATEMIAIANNKVYFGGDHASRIILPIRRTGFSSVENDDHHISSESIVTYNDQATLDIPENMINANATLYDLTGNKIKQFSINRTGTISFNFEYSAGVYILLISNKAESKVYRILHGRNL